MGAKRTIAECWIWNEGRPRGPLAGMSVVGGRAEDICSYRAFLSLTLVRHRGSLMVFYANQPRDHTLLLREPQ